MTFKISKAYTDFETLKYWGKIHIIYNSERK